MSGLIESISFRIGDGDAWCCRACDRIKTYAKASPEGTVCGHTQRVLNANRAEAHYAAIRKNDAKLTAMGFVPSIQNMESQLGHPFWNASLYDTVRCENTTYAQKQGVGHEIDRWDNPDVVVQTRHIHTSIL